MEGDVLKPIELPAGPWLLRPWRDDEADRTAVLRAFADASYRRWNSVKSPSPDEAGARSFLERSARGWLEDTHTAWAITDPAADGAVLGGIGLGPIDRPMRSTAVAYWLLPDARGRGVASGVLRTVSRWAFDELAMHRVQLLHAVGNEPSCRVALRAGFALEGRLRDAMVGTDGETLQDVHVHGRLVTDPPPSFGSDPVSAPA